MIPTGRFLYAEFDPNGANKMFSFLLGCRFNLVPISSDLCAPSSNRMFASKLVSDELIVAMAVFTRHVLAGMGGWIALEL